MVALLRRSCQRYPIVSIEDGMAEDDWDGWAAHHRALGDKIQLVGDDLFVTNTARLKRRHRQGRRQRHPDKGQPDRHADRDSWRRWIWRIALPIGAVMSHRSGETEDTTIADLAVATNCGQIKTGSLSRSDRLAKYNQLLRIEEHLGDQAVYAGRKALKRRSLLDDGNARFISVFA